MTKTFLIGLPGSGRTSIGGAVAEKLGWDFWDLETELAAQIGVPEEQALVLLDESQYRAAEQELFRCWLYKPVTRPTLVALSSGVFDVEGAREMFAQYSDPSSASSTTKLLALRMTLKLLAERSGLNRPRAVGLGTPRAWLRQWTQWRYQLWEELEPIWLDISELPRLQAISQLEKTILES